MFNINEFLRIRGGYIRPSRNQISAWVLVVILVITLSVRNNDKFQVGAFWDDASYVVLAKSISISPTSDGHFGHVSNPGLPIRSRYPFGYPLLLALFAGTQSCLKVFKSVSLIATLVNMSLIFWGWGYLCNGKSHWWSIAAISVSYLSPQVIGHTIMVMSEPIFTTTLLLSFVLVERSVANPQKLLNHVLLGITLFYMIFVRTIGVLLIPVVFLTLIMHLKKKSVNVILVSIASGVVLITCVLTATNIQSSDLWPDAYIDQGTNPENWGKGNIPPELTRRYFDAVRVYVQYHTRSVILPVGGGNSEIELGKTFGIPNLPAAIGTVITIIVVVGVVSSIRRREGLLPGILIFELLYLAVIFVWPWRGPRFLYPLQPILVYQFLTGIDSISTFFASSTKLGNKYLNVPRMAVLGVTIFLILTAASKSYNLEDSRFHLWDLEVGTSWLRENTTEDVVVLARNPDNIYIYSGRHTLNYPEIPTREQLLEFFHDEKVDFVLVAPELKWREDGQFDYDTYTAEKLLPMLYSLADDGFLDTVFISENNFVQVFQVIK